MTSLSRTVINNMPKVRRTRRKPPPGWEVMEATIEEFEEKMKEVVDEPHEGKRKAEALWPVQRLHNEKNRYIFDLYYKTRSISRALYDWLIEEKIADEGLHRRWRQPGYEKLCSLLCVAKKGHNYGTTCTCRIPLKQRASDRRTPCVTSGCISCCSSDPSTPIWWDAPPTIWKAAIDGTLPPQPTEQPPQ